MAGWQVKALREAFMALLLESCAAAGSALLFVSHDTTLGRMFDRTVSLAEVNRASRPAEHAA